MTKTVNKKISFLAAVALTLFNKKPKADIETARKTDFPTDTAKIGISLTDKIRNALRPTWIKKNN
jgi:hypothetical protein